MSDELCELCMGSGDIMTQPDPESASLWSVCYFCKGSGRIDSRSWTPSKTQLAWAMAKAIEAVEQYEQRKKVRA
jgi:hypothetical protein